jgi:hypothetical protein
MSDLDLTHVLASAGPSNYDWLEVDEAQYRALDTLPKQNLDIVPELKEQWSHEGQDSLFYFVPNRDMAGYPVDPRVPEAPHTMGDLSQLHGPIHRDNPLLRLARMALIQSDDTRVWQETLMARFSKQEIAESREALKGVLGERGLLGRLYIAASDFPACANSDAAAPEFVRRYAADARYVVTKEACGDCCHKQKTLSGADRCGVFHKELVPSVEYSEALAADVEKERAACGVQASLEVEPKARIKAAYLGARPMPSGGFSGQENAGALIPASRLLRKPESLAKEASAVEVAKARPIVATLRRELLRGRNVEEIRHGMRLAFDVRDLQATKEQWAPLIREAGLYGVVYSTQDSFDDCREGADFLSKHGSKIRAIVAGDKCTSCIFAKVGRCLMYGRKLVASVDDVYTPETVAAVLDEHKMAGTIPATAIRAQWGETPREALRNIHRVASSPLPTAVDAARATVQTAFRGMQQEYSTGALTRREVLRTASRLMNEGLYGEELQRVMQSKFDPRDLVAASDELRPVVAGNQGLQGIYFIDPTSYDDYGKGCKEAQRLHRTRNAVKYAKVGDKCASCVHQTQLGVCSVLNKRLAAEPPYQDKLAQQRAVLATGLSTASPDYASLINNGLTMIQEFELKSAGTVDLNPAGESFDASIQFGNNDVSLSRL